MWYIVEKREKDMKKLSRMLPPIAMPQPLCGCVEDAAPAEAVESLELSSAIALIFPSDGAEPDYAGAVERLRPSAERGDAVAQYYLGYMYDYGLIEWDYALADEWYGRAAEGGYAKAFAALGVLYQYGLGVEQDEPLAQSYFKRAIDAGLLEQSDGELGPDGLSTIGDLYWQGDGVAQDYSEAIKWYGRAADKGNAEAMNSIGLLYENGLGVEKDSAKAEEWYARAAEAGYQG